MSQSCICGYNCSTCENCDFPKCECYCSSQNNDFDDDDYKEDDDVSDEDEY